MGQVVCKLVGRQLAQGKLQATRQDRGWNFLRIGGGQNKQHMAWWLFQRFQHGVECTGRQHVHFVDDIHLVAACGGRVHGILKQGTHLIHARVGGCIHFQQIDKPALADFDTSLALATRRAANTLLAVHGAGQNSGNGGFAYTAGAGEQIGMVQALIVERVGEGFNHMGLAHQRIKVSRSPFSCQSLRYGLIHSDWVHVCVHG